jgi:16S rRNA (adenine1518-N6/adenine1519-N6)-dimethyltransferase
VQTLAQIKELLESRGLAPRKAFGQNFLIDHNLIKKLVDASGVAAGDVVLEVGPGTGVLSEELLARGCRLVAAEIDRGLCVLLRDRLGALPNFTLVEGDCLDGKHAIAPALLEAMVAAGGGGVGGGNPTAPFRLVANLPYGAATPLMMLLLSDPRCVGQFVTIQKEVAQRVLAAPGTKEYGPLSVVAQLTQKSTLVATLPAQCFWPRPDVTSAMLGMTRLPQQSCEDPAALLAFLAKLFAQRRKQLGTVLATLGCDKSMVATSLPDGITPTARAESLRPLQLLNLWRWWQSMPRPASHA